MNNFVIFLSEASALVKVQYALTHTPVEHLKHVLSERDDLQSALKHSCPQKNEPRIPNLHKPGLEKQKRAAIGYLLHVGHSSRDGGFPFGQAELWQETDITQTHQH